MKYLKIIIVSLILIGMLFVLNGCDVSVAETEKRFVLVSKEDYFDVRYDKTTKVMYAVSCCPQNYGTVTLLVDQEGKPLLYKGE